MARGLTPETTALLRNPSIPSSVLEALFRKGDCFTQVDEKNWLWIIQASSKNLRLNTDKADISGPDLDLSRLHRAIFEFLECPSNFTLDACSAGPPEELDPHHTSWADEIAVS